MDITEEQVAMDFSEQPSSSAEHPVFRTSGPRSSSSEPFTDVLRSSIGQSVIPMVNKLQDIFARLGHTSTIDLPQVAVVGSQSSGKSSVLEALVGRDFLPRGSGICTRRPLVLQLVQTGKDKPEWGEFLHVPGRRFTDFSLIRKEIEEETRRDLGSNKGVSDKQIRLKIFSPNVLNITLVDLPGITKVPVGDQPSDIELRVRSVILSYIRHDSCIILAVSPANADLANSDALQMAKIADPDGSRTIGVITKLDIMDRGTDARSFLLGNVIPLRLGYVGVVNRSQEDIMSNISIRNALVQENNFFCSHPAYQGLSDRCGIPQLAKKLNGILVQHIRNILPGIKARINNQMDAVTKELSSYGELVESKSDRGALLLDIIARFSQVFASIIEGKSEGLSTFELMGGARINYIFQNIFAKRLNEVDPCDDISDEDIQTSIQNTRGPKTIIFVPEEPFEVLVRRQIGCLLHPSLQCAHFIYDELVKISHCCEPLELQRFPALRKRMVEVMGNFLREGLQPAERMIYLLIEMEMDHINTSNPHFVGGNKALEIALQHHRASKSFADMKELSTPVALSEKALKTRAILARTTPSAPLVEHGNRLANTRSESSNHAGSTSNASWGISSFFGGGEIQLDGGKDMPVNKVFSEPLLNATSALATIQLKEPPAVLRASDVSTEAEAVEIAVTRSLIKSYYDIVRKKVQDMVPKAIMHFLVNHTKRGLHNTFIRKLYRESLLEELLQEREEVAAKRKHCVEVLQVLQQAAYTLEELRL